MFRSRCYSSCPEKTYANDSAMQCLDCSEGCLSCTESECFWCKDGFYQLDGACVTDCGSGFYPEEDTGECDTCHRTCDTCTGPDHDECSSCRGFLMIRQGECIDPRRAEVEGHFWDESDNVSKLCDSSCRICNGSATNCTSCPPESFLHASRCISSDACPRGTFASRKYWRCEKCSEGCDVCSENSRHCIKCARVPGQQLFLHNGQCLKTCPDGYFEQASTCTACIPPCKTCQGNARTCLSCESPFLLEHFVCGSSCSEKYTATDGVCRHCPAGCQECADENTCTVCSPTFVLYRESCLEDCPAGYYEELGSCFPCHPDCSKCSGPDADDCEKCSLSSFVLYNGECYGSCPDRTYYEKDTEDCQECSEMCQSCSSSTECVICIQNMVKNSQGVCVMHKDCKHTEYLDEWEACRPCHRTCLRCTGPKNNNCLSCPEKHYFLDGKCLDACPAGYYEDSAGRRCSSCHSTCKTCSGKRSSECLSCSPGWYTLEHSCSQTCMTGFYADNSTGQCKRCHFNCKECFGPEPTDCLSCHSNYFLMEYQKRCYSSCPDHYYEDHVKKACGRCHPTCSMCSGKGALSCTSCVWSYELEGSSCLSRCMTGEYVVQEEPKVECGACHDSCVECKGPGALNCTVCPASSLLYVEEGRCVSCCNPDPKETEECCDCTDTLDECVLRAGLLAPSESSKKTALFIASTILLILSIGAIVFFWRRSRRKTKSISKAGYEKLPDQSKTVPSYKTNRESTSFQHDQVIEYKDRDDEDEEEDDDDIVYMGQDGTVYRKFKYGLLEDDEEDELEYDDESYSFR